MKVIVAADVARGAGHVRMPISQGEANWRSIMSQVCSRPTIERVTLFASEWEICRHVIRDARAQRRSSLKIRQVAGRTSSRESQVLSDSGALVTLLAFHHCVRSQKRKSVEVLLDRLNRDVPTQDSVALGAVGAKLTAMNIGVAVRAVLADISEDRP